MRLRNWLIHRLGGFSGPVEVRSDEANTWLRKNAPTWVVTQIRAWAELNRLTLERCKALQTENQDLRRQAMHVSHVSPDFPKPAA